MANPSQNLTALNTQIAPAWVSEPDGRGTWSILYSCDFTLFLCVWTAIYLIISAPEETLTRQYLRKAKWVFVAILAPELGTFTAWQQWWRAGKLCRDLREFAQRHEESMITTSNPPEDTTNDQRYSQKPISDAERNLKHGGRFSLTYGFFVVMGGLAVDVSDVSDNVSPVTLTPAGVLSLAKQGEYLPVPKMSPLLAFWGFQDILQRFGAIVEPVFALLTSQILPA